MTAPDASLGEGGMRALQAERRRNRELRRALHNLRSAVIVTTNALVDVVENDGGQRNGC